MKKLLLCFLFAGIFFVYSCASVSLVDMGTDLLDKKEFVLTNMAGGEEIFIGFKNGRVYGFSGVNRYTGTYEVSGNDIIFGSIGATMMAGQEDKAIVESKYLELLNSVKTFSLNGEVLQLGELKFKRK